jgi:DNA polymerase-3 subunit epsilon
VRAGEICEKIYRLICPTPNYYWGWFTEEIHGISYDDTKDAPSFPEVWSKLAPLFAGLPLVAHNSSFDEGCLRAVHAVYGMVYPNYEFHCTCRASRRLFARALPNHRLPTVAKHCGHELTAHHNALADAEACAVIALKIL